MPDSVGSDLADALVVVGPPAATMLAYRSVAQKQLAAKKATAEVAAKPPGAPEPAAPHDDPPATGETESANGVLTSKTDIRRAKLDMEQFKGKVF
jgi:hypothetical protein